MEYNQIAWLTHHSTEIKCFDCCKSSHYWVYVWFGEQYDTFWDLCLIRVCIKDCFYEQYYTWQFELLACLLIGYMADLAKEMTHLGSVRYTVLLLWGTMDTLIGSSVWCKKAIRWFMGNFHYLTCHIAFNTNISSIDFKMSTPFIVDVSFF